jgi:hypothetical protein
VASGPGLADLSNAKAGLDELVAVVEQQPDAEDWDLVEALVSRGLEMKLIVPVRRRAERMSTDINDLNAVREAVQRYVNACANADMEALRSALHPAWRMYGIDTSEEEFAVTVDDFVAWASDREPPLDYRATITHIEITADVAVATLVEENYYDTNYTIHFSLIRSGGRWHIVTKTYSRV